MKMILQAVTMAALVGFSAASCPNLCSGHGSCGSHDLCSCYANWQGSDCSLRTCPFGVAWTGPDGHEYSECSNKGSCDRKTGECECFDGYTGEGCSRSTCPEDCSGHGTCEYLSELSGESGWDANKIQGCHCDAGYYGPDCSSRMCLKGDDPLTTVFSKGTQQKDHVQIIKFDTSSTTAGDAFTITFTDLYGAAWTTRPIAAVNNDWTELEGSIKAALESLPNQVVKSVAVTGNGATGNSFDYDVTFLANSGKQNLLVLNTGGCDDNGCQPRLPGLDSPSSISVESESFTGTKEANECSGRGNCDSETGICECTEGFTGEACEQQTVLL